MDLIEIYIQEVTKRVPEKNREDIALELRSTIEDMLPENNTEKDVTSVLAKLGNPAILASGYRDRPMYLIGPIYFDIYTNLLKIIMPIVMAISFISLVVENVVSFKGDEALITMILTIIIKGIWCVLSSSIQVIFWLTLIFAILERTDLVKGQIPLGRNFKEWSPEELKKIHYIPKKKVIKKVDVFGSLLWTAIWVTTYFNAANLVGVYEKGKDGLDFVTPTFNQEVLQSYWPLVVIVIGFEIALAIYKLTLAQWTKKAAFLNTVTQFVSSIVFIVILRNPNLFNQAFFKYFSHLFNTKIQLTNSTFGLIVFIVLLTAVIDSYHGFRKAAIR
jgi:hypothetical protein